MFIKSRVFVLNPLFQALGQERVRFNVSKQVGEADTSSQLRLVSLLKGWEKIPDRDTMKGRPGVKTVEINACGKQKLLDDHVEACLLHENRPRGGILRAQDK